MAEQLWKGRFSKAVDSRVNDFNSSIRFDQRMIAQDMRGSGVHAAMLAKQGIISEKDCEDILSGLASIADDLASGALTIDPNAEDVHTFVEQTLTARIGDAGKRLHTGRSRNDQVALDIRLTLRDYSHTLQAYIVELVKVICRKAAENTKGRGNSPASAMATSDESAKSDSRARGAYTSIAPATNSVVPVGKLPSTMLTATHAGTAKRSISITNGLFNRIAQSATTTADATMAPVYSLRPAPTSASNE